MKIQFSKNKCKQKVNIFFSLKFFLTFSSEILQQSQLCNATYEGDVESALKDLKTDASFFDDIDYPYEKAAKDILLYFIDPFKFALRIMQATRVIQLKWKRLKDRPTPSSPVVQHIVCLAVACMDEKYQTLFEPGIMLSPPLLPLSVPKRLSGQLELHSQ